MSQIPPLASEVVESMYKLPPLLLTGRGIDVSASISRLTGRGIDVSASISRLTGRGIDVSASTSRLKETCKWGLRTTDSSVRSQEFSHEIDGGIVTAEWSSFNGLNK
ncbi:hypothetical protein CYMTET_51281 [Cymbomonas tetramitiformis]|uniref:Uncharacterized protein n=1 Tax=Cymbomonas tetramitiformis TaxID=36881 RepID=A0AAE0BMX2_9CHLO|nr:hypothetical protein CYMTET_51281 [Cymbomonas tetramitiformis]